MENEKHYFAVGVFAMAVLVATAVMVIWILGARGQKDQVTYAIYFDQAINGVNIGSQVKLKGIPVGVVKAIGFDPTNLSRIRLLASISGKAPIDGTTRATVQLTGITGLANVALTNKPEAENGPLAQDIDGHPIIPSEPSTLEQIFDKVPKMVDALQTLAERGQALLSDQNIAAFTESMNTLTRTLNSADKAVQSFTQLSKNGQDFLGPDNNAELRQLLAEGKLTMREIRYLAKSLREDPSQVIYRPDYGGVKPEGAEGADDAK